MAAASTSQTAIVAQAAALARGLIATIPAARRDEVGEELQHALAEPARALVTVVVCGETGRGKSTLINALVDRPGLLPVSSEHPTGAHVAIRAPALTEDEGASVQLGDGTAVAVALDELADWVLDPAAQTRGVRYADVRVRHELLAAGLVLIDTPGVGGLIPGHGDVALRALGGADAAVLVLDARAPVGRSELEFFRMATDRVVDAVVVLNRAFELPGWQDVHRETLAHLGRLQALGGAALVPISAGLKERSDRVAADDPDFAVDLAHESGVPGLRDRLHSWSAERAELLRAARLCRIAGVAAQRVRAREEATVESRDEDPEALERRAVERLRERQALARELPALRRELATDRTVVGREVEGQLASRLTTVRREFEARIADRDLDGIEADLEAALLEAFDATVDDLRRRLASSAEQLFQAAAHHGIEVQGQALSDEPITASVSIAEVTQTAPTAMELIASRMPLLAAGSASVLGAAVRSGAGGAAAGAGVLGLALLPIYPLAIVAGLMFERRRQRLRTERDRTARQIAETANQARAELAIPLYQAVVAGQAAIAEAFEEAAARRLEALDEEITALRALAARSLKERTERVAEARRRLEGLDALTQQLEGTRRAAVAVLRTTVTA